MLFWKADKTTVSREEFDERLGEIMQQDKWIIDGNYGRTLELRLKECDTVFFFDLPTVTCLAGISKRVLSYYGKTREDMGGNCVERFDSQKVDLYRNVITFNKQHRKDYYDLLSKESHAKVIIFHNRQEADKFLTDVK